MSLLYTLFAGGSERIDYLKHGIKAIKMTPEGSILYSSPNESNECGQIKACGFLITWKGLRNFLRVSGLDVLSRHLMLFKAFDSEPSF